MSDFKDRLKQSRGYGAFEQKEKEIEEKQKNFVARHWMPADSSTQLVFLDDDPVILEEHQMKLDNDWRNWFTCYGWWGMIVPFVITRTTSPTLSGSTR